MYVLLDDNNIFVRILRESEDLVIGDIRHPRALYALWSEAERNAIGVYVVAEAPLTNEQLRYHDNVFDYVYEAATATVAQVLVSSTPRPDKAQQIIAGIKEQAALRIEAVLPAWKQRDFLARSVELLEKGQVNWTALERAEADQMRAHWDWIKSVRVTSNALEKTLPVDFMVDTHWTIPPIIR